MAGRTRTSKAQSFFRASRPSAGLRTPASEVSMCTRMLPSTWGCCVLALSGAFSRSHRPLHVLSFSLVPAHPLGLTVPCMRSWSCSWSCSCLRALGHGPAHMHSRYRYSRRLLSPRRHTAACVGFYSRPSQSPRHRRPCASLRPPPCACLPSLAVARELARACCNLCALAVSPTTVFVTNGTLVI